MLDFVQINVVVAKRGELEIVPDFMTPKSKDLMTKGHGFYAIWDENKGTWLKDEFEVVRLVDEMTKAKAKEVREAYSKETTIRPKYLRNFSTGLWTKWQTYVKSLPDNYHELDAKVIFSNTEVKKTDYSSTRLSYALEEGPMPAYEELIGTLYSETERRKIEWAIGSIIAGDSKKIQKFLVFYGEAGSGKGTILENVIQAMFEKEKYSSVFKASNLASKNNQFSLEAFKDNPLIAIDFDGDLSKIEDNTTLNSLISHETMLVNEKFRSQYPTKFHTFLFMGTNRPVKISEARSGILRRLIDVSPSGNTIEGDRYLKLVDQVQFEFGAIAYHCLKVYKKLGRHYYDSYRPNLMMGATNDFYNFIEDNYDFFSDDSEGIVLEDAWNKYRAYCIDAAVPYTFQRRIFKEELKSYFREFKERHNGRYKVYFGFKREKFDYVSTNEAKPSEKKTEPETWLKLDKTESLFDEVFKNCPAQYASDDSAEKPEKRWYKLRTKLSDLDTHKLHYILVPENLIVIDFDIKDENGNKDPKANLEAASKFPPTYAEFSKSGGGIHLHYYYNGDVLQLSRIFEENVEIKVFKKQDGSRGYSSLRRALSYCNDIPIAPINSGLPLKGAKNMVNFEAVKSERSLRTMIIRNLNKEYWPNTTPSVQFIKKILDDAYSGDLSYDVTDLRPAVLAFAMDSHNQPNYCMDLVAEMKFKSDEPSECCDNYPDGAMEVIFDVEVFPNLFIICWKALGTPEEQTVTMINPDPEAVRDLFKFKLIGFNNRRYDNHILYAASLGYSNQRLYDISREIVSDERKDKSCFFGEAYNLSYTDIYDFSSKKQSLKKWEIELGIHHQELGLPWDKPVPEEMWDTVAKYCINDVVATEAVFNARHEDFVAREILADISGLTVNDTTNSHTTRMIVGVDKTPQSQFVYTDLSKDFPGYIFDPRKTKSEGKSHYRGESVGEGGYVYSEPKMYSHVALLDVQSMHPNSAINLNIFGPYTKNFKQLVDARIAIKHGDYKAAGEMFGGKLAKYLTSEQQADSLSYALKIAINSVYGLTAAGFPNKLRDPRNKDNIVAKRGALFMVDLKNAVQEKGFTVAHIKTDSIKIPNATTEIIQFVMDFGKKYGYTFEHEATYDRMCLVNDAVYIAKYLPSDICMKEYGYVPSANRKHFSKHDHPWTATGTQFQIPYVFKTLFSKEKIEFEDMCETKSTTKGLGLYLDLNEGLPEGEHRYQFVGRVGQFCPILPGNGGGVLLREADGKYYSATGTKKDPKKVVKGTEELFYRWLQSESVRQMGLIDKIDRSYYNELVDEAVSDISKYGDFEWFVSNDTTAIADFMNIPEDSDDEIPFDEAV